MDGRYDQIVSLGLSCAPAAAIREHFGVERAFPFDWWVSPIEGVIKALGAEVDSLFVPAEVVVKPHGRAVHSTRYGIAYFHDFERTPDGLVAPGAVEQGLDAVREKYRALFGRLDRAVQHGRTLFVRYDLGETNVDLEVARTLALRQALDRRWPRRDIDLLALPTDSATTDYTGFSRDGVLFENLGPASDDTWRRQQFRSVFDRLQLELAAST